MNCFEARNDFVAFWQKALTGDRRAEMLAHLQQCAACDHSFRSFALTAPVLYSASEPLWTSEVAQPTSRQSVAFEFPSEARVAEHRSLVSRWNRLVPALVMAAAAVIAVYFAVPPRMTFEDAIAAENGNAEVASYPAADSLFGQELIAQGTAPEDVANE
jgi:hypothetical protein